MKGHIRPYKDKDGKTVKDTWRVIVPIGKYENGKTKYKWETVYGPRKVADAKLAELLNKLNSGTFADAGKMTFGDLLDRWLETEVSKTVKTWTYNWYKMVVDHHLKPELGSHKLSKLSPAHLQDYYKTMLDSGRVDRTIKKEDGTVKYKDKRKEAHPGLSPSAVAGHHRIIHKALDMAWRWGLVARNIADLAEPPKVEKKPMKAFTMEQARTFLDAAKDSKYYSVYVTAILTGMRAGELLGLQWEDIDFDNKVIKVQRTLKKPGISPIFSTVKTKKGYRSIYMFSEVEAILTKIKADQAKEKEDCGGVKGIDEGGHYEDYGLIFTIPGGRPIHRDNMVNRDFYKILSDNKLPQIRFHDLRHSFASILLGKGVHPKIVSEMLGHSGIGITMDIYSHAIVDFQKDAINTLGEGILGKK